MTLLTCLTFSILLGVSNHAASAETAKTQQQPPSRKNIVGRVSVPEQVVTLVRPILDLRQESIEQCGEPGSSSKCIQGDAYEREQQRQKEFADLLAQLTQRKETAADEALVVLMWFYVGESQEEADAVIARGPKMLAYLAKYRHARPKISTRAYPNSIFKNPTLRSADFTPSSRNWKPSGTVSILPLQP
jgi:hypothetical protein